VFACIPALNEASSIGSVILEARRYVDRVFVCDDGSIDLTGELAETLGAFVIRHDTTKGKGASLRDLFTEALKGSPDVVVVLDADRQHDPDYIPYIVKPILSGDADIVVGSRFLEGSKTDAPLYRRIGLRFFNWIGGNLGVKDTQSGFRAYTPEALNAVIFAHANGYGVEMEQLYIAKKKGLRVVEVPIEVRYDVINPSKKHPLLHGIDLIMTLIRIAAEERFNVAWACTRSSTTIS
jgi:glycosyltransferase involved in cell wall biosynthesis